MKKKFQLTKMINKNSPSYKTLIKEFDLLGRRVATYHCDTTAPSDRDLYHLQFSLQAASPETSGYTLVCVCGWVLILLLSTASDRARRTTWNIIVLPQHLPWETEETHDKPQNSQSPGRDSNPEPI
jgi:hypothetical protein